MGGLATLPTTNSPAHVLFNLPRMKSTPATLELSLTPGSAFYYEIVGGPLRFTTPSGTNSSVAGWTRIRSTGKQTVGTTGSTRQLTPPLVFQARVSASGAETLAYGQRCRISDAAIEAIKKLADLCGRCASERGADFSPQEGWEAKEPSNLKAPSWSAGVPAG
jgi:hypothetical protein